MDKKRNVEILLILLMLLFNILGCRLVDGQDPGVLPENAELFYNSLVLKADCSFNSTISEEFNCDPTVTLRTKHIDSNLLTWEMSQKNTCSWITINPSSGKLSGTPKRKDLGTCLLAFKVKPSINQNNTSRSSDQLNIDELDEKETNFSSSMTIKPPMLALDFSNCTTAVSIGSFFNCKATANNGLEDSSFTYKLSSSNNCHWASIINPQTGFLTGKPASSDVGKCILGITAIDDLGSQSSKDITINIPEATVDITSTDCRNTGNVSENYSCKVLGSTNLANESILWTRGSNHTCEWITINPTTGEANGKPPLSSSGISCNISIYATILDGYAQGNFVQKINITPVSLTIDNDNCATNISVNTHQTCQASITASISNPVVSWKILSDNNCKFAQVSNSTGNIDLSPSINDVGTCRLSVSASLNESIFTTFKKTITVPSIPINIDLSQCISQLQALNSYNCTALADSNIPGISSYTWKKSTENTCSWIEINSTTGVISGTPAIAQTGPCNLGITASVGNASYSNTKKPISVEIRWFKQSTISDQPWATNDRAGTSISMDNGLIAVGAPEINHGDGSQGQVVIYSQSE
ncbi:MAG: hypothetical protein KDD50_08560, partial [Bdellovibrionales bacterium]|nr:hypothetical protein [Bdellovibrionales bacterium]